MKIFMATGQNPADDDEVMIESCRIATSTILVRFLNEL